MKLREGEIRDNAKRHMVRCSAMLETLTAEDKEVLKAWEDKPVEDLRRQIQTEEDTLEAIHEGNPNAIRQYEKREADIRELLEVMDTRDQRIKDVEGSMVEVRGAWEPQIDRLISNISEAFSKSFEFINCAGQVKVHKEGKEGIDFEKWAVQILVKFRCTLFSLL